ncbi:MAG: serine/threonine protein kinase [Betaproteobacteria bacterium]|nr:serine/threonine protein kinase [Betaproteobacteria bacterium]
MTNKMMPPEVLKVDYLRGSRYVVAKEFHGGMGTVYKLFPVAGGSPTVAMKTIRGDSSVQAFDIECEAWFSVAHHPNIARPIAFGTWESLPSVVMEWYPKSLDDLDLKGLTVGEIKKLISETIGALHFAFAEKGLIHQDIKPANVLIDKSGRPRLSDFGLARCMAPTVKERIELGITGVPKSTSKELSGTPYFMAPELWDGVPPSVRTDIFSLGVTFYHSLTKEHPFVEDMASRVIRNELRLNPLMASVSEKTGEGRQVMAFLKKCLALDPKQRYQTYQEMTSDLPWLDFAHDASEWSVERSNIIAGTAQFFRTKGDVKKSFAALEWVLNRRPKDVILIEELANLHSAIGKTKEAELHYGLAYNNLRASHGVYEGHFLPRPALAWARSRIRSGRFQDAADIVKEVLAWYGNHSDKSKPNELLGSGMYSEVGWYLLYQGEFSRAAYELATYASRHSLDKLESIWIVEAAWLSGTIKVQADEIALKVMEIKPDVAQSPGELEFVWSRVILHEYANPLLRGELWKSNPSYMFTETRNLETAAGFAAGALLMPKELDKQKPFVSTMDTYSTGGMHHGFIRSLSKI